MKLALAVVVVMVIAIGTLAWVFQSGLTRFDQEIVSQEEQARLKVPFHEGVDARRGSDQFKRAPRPRVESQPAKVAKREVSPEVEVEIPEVFEVPVLAATLESSPARADDRLRLVTEIPEAMFEGTKVPLKIPNLEPIEVKQKPFLVPTDLRNLALEKKVEASDLLPVIGDLEYVTDGDKDAADGSYVELGPGLQWVQIDLEQAHELHAVWVWHFHKSARAYLDVVVQLSDDPTFPPDRSLTIYNADHDNSSGLGNGKDKAYVETNQGRIMSAGRTVARYVRLYSNGNSSNEMNHYIEVEVWGRAIQY